MAKGRRRLHSETFPCFRYIPINHSRLHTGIPRFASVLPPDSFCVAGVCKLENSHVLVFLLQKHSYPCWQVRDLRIRFCA